MYRFSRPFYPLVLLSLFITACSSSPPSPPPIHSQDAILPPSLPYLWSPSSLGTGSGTSSFDSSSKTFSLNTSPDPLAMKPFSQLLTRLGQSSTPWGLSAPL